MFAKSMSRAVQRWWPILIAAAVLLALAPSHASAQTNVGTLGPSFTGASAPTGQKPQSKLWWHAGKWWGVLFDTTARRFTIWRFDWGTDTWTNTGVVVDARSQTSADTLWTGANLYVATHIKEGSSNADMTAKLQRYSYVAGTDTYQLDSGYPLTLTSGAIEALVIDADSLGRIWATWTTANTGGGRQVMVTRSAPGGTGFITPFVLPAPGAANLTSDDISTLVSFSFNDSVDRIGVLWSNQNDGAVNFAFHNDADPDGTWTLNQAMQGPQYADDHLNIKGLRTDPSGNVYAVVKTSLNDAGGGGGQPLILVLKLDNAGSWQRRTYSTVQYNQTRPILLIDGENRQMYVFAATPCCSGGIIHYKSTGLDNPNFVDGTGAPFMEQATSTTINNPTSTKQALTSTTNLLVIAGDDNSKRYVFNKIDLLPAGGGGDTTPPQTTIDSGPTGTVTTGTATFTFSANEAGSTFACQLDGGPSTPCSSGVTYTNLGVGGHTFAVAATDPAGNTDLTPATRAWTVTTGGGGGTIVRQSTSGGVSTSPSTTATATAPAGVSAGDVLVACVALNGTTVTAAPSGWTGFAAVTSISNPKVYGYYKVAGGSEPSSYTWNLAGSAANSVGIARYSGVDTVAPTDGSSLAAGPAAVNGTVPAVTTTVPGTMLTGCMGINTSATSVNISPPSGMTEVWDIGGKRQEYADQLQPSAGSTGARTWTFTSSRAWAGWMLALRPGATGPDLTPPDTTITSGPSGTVTSTTATFTFTATEAGSTFTCSLDAATPTTCTSGITYTDLTEAEHTFTVAATDPAGNTDPTPATRTWTINTQDTTPPDTTITSGPSGTVTSTTATFTFTATEAGSTFTCSLDGATPTTCTSGVSYTSLADGDHTFTVAATDPAGNTDPTPATRTWTINTAGGSGIVRASTSTAVATTASNVATVTAPTGTGANDVLVACIVMNGSTVTAAPAGWTQFAAITNIANPRVYGYYKVAGASEPGTYSWNLAGSVAHSIGVSRYTGVNTTTPINASTGASGPSATSGTVPSITTTVPGTMLTGCVGINSGSTTIDIAPPAGLSEVWDIGGKRQEYADGLQSAAGATGAKTWTFTASREWAGWLVALRPN